MKTAACWELAVLSSSVLKFKSSDLAFLWIINYSSCLLGSSRESNIMTSHNIIADFLSYAETRKLMCGFSNVQVSDKFNEFLGNWTEILRTFKCLGFFNFPHFLAVFPLAWRNFSLTCHIYFCVDQFSTFIFVVFLSFFVERETRSSWVSFVGRKNSTILSRIFHLSWYKNDCFHVIFSRRVKMTIGENFPRHFRHWSKLPPTKHQYKQTKC